jgi:hypothetical protein
MMWDHEMSDARRPASWGYAVQRRLLASLVTMPLMRRCWRRGCVSSSRREIGAMRCAAANYVSRAMAFAVLSCYYDFHIHCYGEPHLQVTPLALDLAVLVFSNPSLLYYDNHWPCASLRNESNEAFQDLATAFCLTRTCLVRLILFSLATRYS